MEDDVYDGRLIPRGSLVFANIWAMLRDPEVFPDPERFDPERYLEKVDEETARRRDPRVFVFGFGRRRCPGAHLVESSVWLMLATMLATLDVEKPRDKRGKVIEPEVKFENSVFRSAPSHCWRIRTHLILGRPLASLLSCDHDPMPPLGLLKNQLEEAR
jgi:cytochrome P450